MHGWSGLMAKVWPEVLLAVAIAAAIVWARHDAVSDLLQGQRAQNATEQIETYKEIDDALSNLPSDHGAIREQLRQLAQ